MSVAIARARIWWPNVQSGHSKPRTTVARTHRRARVLCREGARSTKASCAGVIGWLERAGREAFGLQMGRGRSSTCAARASLKTQLSAAGSFRLCMPRAAGHVCLVPPQLHSAASPRGSSA